jgi:hypothetical protein
LAKYTRQHLLAAINGLRVRREFKGLTLDDFPVRQVALTRVKQSRYTLDLNEDTDGSVDIDSQETEDNTNNENDHLDRQIVIDSEEP